MQICASDLTCVRSGREVFAHVNFAVESGEALVVLGRNGTGKSSLLRMIAGLIRVAAGRLTLEDGDPELTLPEQAHYLGHQDPVKPSLTVAENLAFWMGYLGGIPESRALATVGLDAIADLPAAYLSAGQRRRLSIARLIAVPRPIWLLDEPTSALDVPAQVRLTEIMRQHRAGGGIILAATHGPVGLEAAKELRLGESAAKTEPPAPGEAP